MENGLISDMQISASSSLSSYQDARLARLHYAGGGGYAGSWVAATNDIYQWLKVDLRSYYTKVPRVATQGRQDHDSQWVTTYNLQYSDDDVNFQHYMEQGQSVNKVM